MKKYIAVFAAFVVLSLVVSVFFNNNYISKSKLERFENQNAGISFVHYGIMYNNDIKISLKDLLGKNNALLQQVYTQINDYVYFSYQYVKDESVHWCIGKIKSNETDFEVVCDEIVESGSLHSFKINLKESYDKRNGYVYNDIIVLTDFTKLIEYNVKTEKTEVFDYCNYKHPTDDFSCSIKEYKEITITQNGETKILTISDLIEKNSFAKIVFEKYNNTTVNNTKACAYFFDNVQYVDGKTYFICRIHRWDGCAYALVFEYNFQTENVKYCGGHYTNDMVRKFYVVSETR